MRTVKVLVCEVKEVQIPEELYQDGQYDSPPINWSDERYERYMDAIYKIGKMVGYDLAPEDGCEWFSERYIKDKEIWNGVIAILNEQDEVMAQA